MSVTDNLTVERSQEALDKVRAQFETAEDRLAVVTPDRYDEVYTIMKDHFVPDEPLCGSFGVVWEKEFEQFTHDNLKDNVSICMISKETNEVMGIRIIGIMKRTDKPPNFQGMTYDPLKELFIFLTHDDSEVNFYDRLGVDEAIHFFTLGVHKNYRRRGLGSRLLKAAVAMSRELGFKAIKGEGTSNFSQRIYEKEGFDTLHVMPYDTYKTPAGHFINERTGVHTNTKLYALKL